MLLVHKQTAVNTAVVSLKYSVAFCVWVDWQKVNTGLVWDPNEKDQKTLFLSREMKAGDKKDGGGTCNWGRVKDHRRYSLYFFPSQIVIFCDLHHGSTQVHISSPFRALCALLSVNLCNECIQLSELIYFMLVRLNCFVEAAKIVSVGQSYLWIEILTFLNNQTWDCSI